MARKYTIKTGGTLSGIAQLFYGDSSLFPLIAGANGITNPNVVAVGQVIAIPDLPQHWEPFTTFGEFDDNGESIGRFKFPNKVPPGKRLVIETVTGCYYGDGAVLGPARSQRRAERRPAGQLFVFVGRGWGDERPKAGPALLRFQPLCADLRQWPEFNTVRCVRRLLLRRRQQLLRSLHRVRILGGTPGRLTLAPTAAAG